MSTARGPKSGAKKTGRRPARKPAKGPDDNAVDGAPALPPGHWVAWDRERKKVLAVGDDFWEVLQKALATGEEEPHVEKTPGIHPAVAERPFTLQEGESPDIIEDVKKAFPGYADEWLDTPNPLVGGARPRDVIGTEQEKELRYYLRGIRDGIFS